MADGELVIAKCVWPFTFIFIMHRVQVFDGVISGLLNHGFQDEVCADQTVWL